MRRIVTFLLYVVAFTIPWQEFVTIPYVGTIARLVSYVALALVPIAFLFSPRIRPLRGIHVCMGAFLLWSLASLLWTIDREMSFDRVALYLRILGMSWMVWEFTPTLQGQKHIMQAFIWGGMFSIINQFWAYLTAESLGMTIMRVSGGALNANDLAYVLVASLIFAYYLAVDHTAKQWWRRIYWGYIGLAAVSTLLTASRMGVLCLGLCLLGLCLWLLRRNATAALLLLVFMGASLGAAVLWVLPKEGVARLRTTRESFAGETGEADQLGGRLAIWKAGLILAKQSPIIGYGAGTFQVVITREYYHPRVVTAHNSYLSIQVGLGIVGLIFFVGVQLFAVKYAWGLPKTERFIWMILLGTLYLASTALGLEHSKTVWLVMGLVTSHADTMLAWRNDCVR